MAPAKNRKSPETPPRSQRTGPRTSADFLAEAGAAMSGQIEFEDVLRVADSDPVASLDLSMFGHDDLVKIVLQRHEVLNDRPRPGVPVRRWSRGDDAPVNEVVDELGETLARRSAAFIYLEFLSMRPILDRLAPARLADIGCGFAFFDLFAARQYDCDLVLIDVEETEDRHFGFSAEAAAYASLSTARRMLVANGVPDARVRTINPNHQDLTAVTGADLATSFVSCGFHYPWSTYQEFFAQNVTPDGSVILDIRRRRQEKDCPAMTGLGQVSEVEGIYYGDGKALRILIEKQAKAQAA